MKTSTPSGGCAFSTFLNFRSDHSPETAGNKPKPKWKLFKRRETAITKIFAEYQQLK
ncbi:hypothetical protein ACONUD_14200 [Microbulbifer harenosus]|uniref:hypothetical protein n=1 Tax=Microbulbifer harenosus TaxID=2576840 RepID=UPI00148511C2